MKTLATVALVILALSSITYSASESISSQSKNGWAAYLAKQDTSTPKNLAPFLQKCLLDFSLVKIGMTRGEIEQKLAIPGGINGVSPTRYTLPQCPFFIIEVTFDFKRDPADQNRAIESKDDKAISISRPYLENPVWD